MGHVTFLGTGDLLNWERAQSCLAVPLAGDETMLLDVSSGTVLLRQLQDAGIAPQSIRHVFVSHCHFDHSGGLVPLLVALTALPEASLKVHALPETIRALRGLLALTIPGVEDWLGGRLRWGELASGQSTLAGDVEVTPFEVDHDVECAGFRISQGESTLVYAADTRPCQELVDHARDVDLLVHEAYGLEKDAEQAHTFGHSTAAEAGRVALAAGAKRLILTHIRSSRYVLPAELVEEAKTTFGGPVAAGRDLDSTSEQPVRVLSYGSHRSLCSATSSSTRVNKKGKEEGPRLLDPGPCSSWSGVPPVSPSS